jgi:very-short-patch-repair endonuclease
VRTGRLHRKHHGVYSVGHAQISQEGEWMAAVLAAGEGAALSHLSAAKLWNVWRRKVRGIDVTSPQRRQVKGVRVHTSRHLDPRDVTVHQGIPVTTVPRMLVDLANVLTSHQLANVIHEAEFRNRFSERATRAAMQRASGRRGLITLEQALAARAAGSAGTKSDLEDRFLALVQTTGLPDPVVNAAVQTRHRTYEVDFRWGDLCVEIDGPGHRRPRTKKDDAARDHALSEAGLRVVRLSDEASAEELLKALTPRPPRHPAAGPRPP